MTVRNERRKQARESRQERILKEEERSIRKCRKEEQQFRSKRYSIEEKRIFRKKMTLFNITQLEQLARNFILEHSLSYNIVTNEWLESFRDENSPPPPMFPIVYALFYECVVDYVKTLLEKAALIAEEESDSLGTLRGITVKESAVVWARCMVDEERNGRRQSFLGFGESFWKPFLSKEYDDDEEEGITDSSDGIEYNRVPSPEE
jgi:hypothetical protein